MSDLGDKLRKLASEKLEFIMRNREAYLEAWVAEHGSPPSECYLEERDHGDGRTTVRVVQESKTYAQGRADERRAVVEWLRAQSRYEDDLREAADDIERGEHLKEEKEWAGSQTLCSSSSTTG